MEQDGAGDGDPSRRLTIAALLAIVAAGIALRLLNLLGGRAFWLDELYLQPNILDRGFGALASPLVNQQIAPLGLLVGSKLTGLLPGDAELTLRVFPFLAELLGFLLFYPMMRRAGASRAAGLIGLACVAVLHPFVRHGPELKQYGTEFAVTVVITILALAALERVSLGRRGALALGGLVAGPLSITAPAILAPAGALLLLDDLRRRDWRGAALTCAMGAAWVAAFLLPLAAILNRETQADMQGRFWDWAFLPLPLSPYTAQWLLRRFFEMFEQSAGFREAAGFAAFLAICGAAHLAARGRKATLVLFVAPILLALIASAARYFPFQGRVLHFATPGLVALTAIGAVMVIEALARHLSRRGRALVAAGIVLLLLGPGGRTTVDAARKTPPFEREGIETVLRQILSQREPGDVLYLHSKAVAGATRFAARENVDLAPVVYGHDPLASAAHFLADLEALPAERRVWFVIGGGWLGATADLAEWSGTHLLGEFGTEILRLRHLSATAILLDFGDPAARPDTPEPVFRRGDPGPYRPDQLGDLPPG